MQLREAINDLHYSLEHITAEDDLLKALSGGLAALRQSYPSHRSFLTQGDIEFLQSLGVISDHLRAFIELKEELATVSSLKEYEEIVSRLACAKGSLACLPVSRRIAKEMRGLHERLPAIREQDDAQQKSRLSSRILDLEQNHRRCPHHHPMVIREGTHGHFWGCSRYPFCCVTAQLTPEENDRLTC